MNRISKILAGGPPAVLAAGGGLMYAQHELHYLLRPSIIETLAGIAALGGAVVWSRNRHKAKAEQQDTAQTPTSKPPMVVWEPTSPTQALPPAQKRTLDFTRDAQRQRQHDI